MCKNKSFIMGVLLIVGILFTMEVIGLGKLGRSIIDFIFLLSIILFLWWVMQDLFLGNEQKQDIVIIFILMNVFNLIFIEVFHGLPLFLFTIPITFLLMVIYYILIFIEKKKSVKFYETKKIIKIFFYILLGIGILLSNS